MLALFSRGRPSAARGSGREICGRVWPSGFLVRSSSAGMEGVELKEWSAVGSQLRLSQVERLEESVHIRCVSSTDFVLGRQTNFNGPVTIINCQDVLKRAPHLLESTPRQEEQIVIQEKVMSQSAATRIRNMATSKQTPQVDQPTDAKRRRRTALFLCIGLFVAAVTAAPIFLTMDWTKEDPKTFECTRLADDICLYTNFHWGGRPISSPGEPLQLPVPYLAVARLHSQDYCYYYDQCLEVLKNFQLNRTDEPPCNFLIGTEGNVYEDCGWEVVSVPEGPHSGRLLRVCFMGDFEENWPTYLLVEAFRALLRFAVERNYLAEDYVLVGWQLSGAILRVASKWPRFRNESLFPE